MSTREKKKKRVRTRRAQNPTSPATRTHEPAFLWAWRISAALGATLVLIALFSPRLSQTTNLYFRVAGAALFVTAFLFFRTRK